MLENTENTMTAPLGGASKECTGVLDVEGIETIEIRDNLGRPRARFDLLSNSADLYAADSELRFRVTDGKLEVACSAGIRFVTPKVMEFVAGEGVRIAAGTTSCQIMPAGVKLAGEDVTVVANSVNLSGATLKARLERITLTVGKLEQFADRIFQHARHSYQRIEMLLHTRAGRIRTEAAESHLLEAESLRVVAEEEVRIQANSINLN